MTINHLVREELTMGERRCSNSNSSTMLVILNGKYTSISLGLTNKDLGFEVEG